MSRPTVATKRSRNTPSLLAAKLAARLQPQARLRWPELFPLSVRERKAAAAAKEPA